MKKLLLLVLSLTFLTGPVFAQNKDVKEPTLVQEEKDAKKNSEDWKFNRNMMIGATIAAPVGFWGYNKVKKTKLLKNWKWTKRLGFVGLAGATGFVALMSWAADADVGYVKGRQAKQEELIFNLDRKITKIRKHYKDNPNEKISEEWEKNLQEYESRLLNAEEYLGYCPKKDGEEVCKKYKSGGVK